MLRVANSMDSIQLNSPSQGGVTPETGLDQIFNNELMQLLGQSGEAANTQLAPVLGQQQSMRNLANTEIPLELLLKHSKAPTSEEVLKELGLTISNPKLEQKSVLSTDEPVLDPAQMQGLKQFNPRAQYQNPMQAYALPEESSFNAMKGEMTKVRGQLPVDGVNIEQAKWQPHEIVQQSEAEVENPLLFNLDKAKHASKANLAKYQTAQNTVSPEGTSLISKANAGHDSTFKQLDNGFSDGKSSHAERAFHYEGDGVKSEGFSKSFSSSQTMVGGGLAGIIAKNGTQSSRAMKAEVSGDSDVSQISEKILDYIKQNVPLKDKTVEVKFHHESVGNVFLEVSQAGKDAVHINIRALKPEGFDFFEMNKMDIMKTLGSSGIKVSDFNISQDSNSQHSHFSSNDRSQQQQQGRGQQGDSERRRELWEMFDKRNAA